MLHKFFGPFAPGRPALGLLIIRFAFGLGLMLHGWPKFQNPFHWMDKMPGAPPAIMQFLAALSEFGGGLAMILGLLTPLACLGIAATMLVAMFTVHVPKGQPYVAAGGGPSWELAGHYLAAALGLLISGPGALSLDAMLFGRAPNRTDLPLGNAGRV